MLVLINGKQDQKTYDEICHTLGFIPEVKFVKVTSTGRINFTAGKPQEIRALKTAVREKGFTASAKMNRVDA